MRRSPWTIAGMGMGMALALALAVGAGTAAATTLRFADYGPNRGARAEALQWFAAELEDRSNGAIRVQFFWGGSLLSGRDTLTGVADGVADLGTVIGFFTPRELRAYTIGDLPVADVGIRRGLHAMHGLARAHPALQRQFSDAGVVYLSSYTTGPVQLACRRAIPSLDALKGVRVRASGPYGDTFRALGAEVTPLSQGEVYQALNAGLIDCNQTYYYAMRSYRQYEVAPHVLELDWGQNMAFGIAMNAAAHARLSEAERHVLHAVSEDFLDHLATALEAEQAAAKAAMIAGIDGHRITVTPLPADQKRRLATLADTAVQAWVAAATADGLDGAGLLAAYRARLEAAPHRPDGAR